MPFLQTLWKQQQVRQRGGMPGGSWVGRPGRGGRGSGGTKGGMYRGGFHQHLKTRQEDQRKRRRFTIFEEIWSKFFGFHGFCLRHHLKGSFFSPAKLKSQVGRERVLGGGGREREIGGVPSEKIPTLRTRRLLAPGRLGSKLLEGKICPVKKEDLPKESGGDLSSNPKSTRSRGWAFS